MPIPVTRAQFEEAVENGAASPSFREQFARFAGFDTLLETEAFVHVGDLRIKGSYRTPGLCTLITGNLVVEDVLDLNPRHNEGGLFIVFGDLTCRHLLGDYGSIAFVDGDLAARDTIVTGYRKSVLSVIGTLRTRLFVGCDGATFVGAGAEIEYGVGHCVPMGELGAAPILPRKGEKATARAVVPKPNAKGWMFEPEQFATLIREGRAVFR